MGVATAGGYICPACGLRTLIVSQSMYDHEQLWAYCTQRRVIERNGGERVEACGWSWDKNKHGPRDYKFEYGQTEEKENR